MYKMIYKIQIGSKDDDSTIMYELGMLESVEIHKSVELLASTCVITIPAAQYNKAMDIETHIGRGSSIMVWFGYENTSRYHSEMLNEFDGWVQRISTDGGSIKLYCEDDIFKTRVLLPNKVMKNPKLNDVLQYVIDNIGFALQIKCEYDWSYTSFVFNNATGYDVLKKVKDECGADVYIDGDTLYVVSPYSTSGRKPTERIYDMAQNVERSDLEYHDATDRKIQVTVKANMPDGSVKEMKIGTNGGDSVTLSCPSHEDESMKQLGESEIKRRAFSGLEGSITTWLIPLCLPGDTATIIDADYPQKDGSYYVKAVDTTFSEQGGVRKIVLGQMLS